MDINKQLKHRNPHEKYESVEINIQRNQHAKKGNMEISKQRKHRNQHARKKT